MKSSERHRLKENEVAHWLGATREYVQPRRKQITGLLFVLFLIVIAIVGISVMRQRTQERAHRMLADAMVALNAPVVPPEANPDPTKPPAAATAPAGSFTSESDKLNAALPKLRAAADAYPDADAGITARYHLAGTLALLGRHQEAIQAFDDVIKRGGDSIYGQMARLGKADAQAKAGQLDPAIATFKELAARKDGDLPVDAILMELGRAYVTKGNREEARRTFTQIVDEHADSPYAAEARQELEALKG